MADKGNPRAVTMAPTQGGTLVICETVLAEIAYVEAMGIAGFVPAREGLVKGILRRNRPRGILVEASAHEVAFHVTVGVREGVCIPDLANELRRRVAAAVGEKTGYAVRAVNVLVDHVAFGEGS